MCEVRVMQRKRRVRERLRPGGNRVVPLSGYRNIQPRPQYLELHPHRDGK